MIIQREKIIKRREEQRKLKIILIILLIFILIILSYSYVKIHERRTELEKGIRDLKREIKNLELQNETLKKQILEKNSPDYLEKIARTRFNLKKPGEEVFIIVSPEKESLVRKIDSSPTEKKSFWQKFFEIFSQKFLRR